MKLSFDSKTIAVYSVSQKSGKSTVARELSGFYQISGKKSLLVDFTLGKSKIMKYMPDASGEDLSMWVGDINRKLSKLPWPQIEYRPEEVTRYIFNDVTGMGILSCRPIEKPERMMEITGIILRSLAQSPYDVIVFDLESGVKDYIIRVLESVDTVLLVADTFRYDVIETREVIERLKEANCRTDHFKLLFNKKPTLLDQTPMQVAGELNLPLSGALPDYPDIRERLQYSLDKMTEYSQAMESIIENL
ncbi:MAG: hypothetical protein JL50_14135 [Peptococcaceae bacterium BICA1-7]|nr:MAG: hypothetical protein JL50_14135 [Peptococcaceae bacterium BICA1-7]HBV96420.1 hypothetical protein [Desulfotomaculum sp.]